MSGLARYFPLYKGCCPSWNWVFAQQIPAGGELVGPAVKQEQEPGGGGGFAPMAPAGDPPPTNAIFEPGRYTVTALIRTTTGLTYIYVFMQQAGGTAKYYKVYVNDWFAITELGINPVLRIPQVDYWWIRILNRSAVDPAYVEGAVSIYARGFL